jgi:hypothetical protein
MLGQTSLPNDPVAKGQSLTQHYLQVEAAQAASTRDVGSNKKTWLLMVGFGFGCFALGAATACLVLPSATHADSLQKTAHHVQAFSFDPQLVMASRTKAGMSPTSPAAFRTPSSSFRQPRAGSVVSKLDADSQSKLNAAASQIKAAAAPPPGFVWSFDEEGAAPEAAADEGATAAPESTVEGASATDDVPE